MVLRAVASRVCVCVCGEGGGGLADRLTLSQPGGGHILPTQYYFPPPPPPPPPSFPEGNEISVFMYASNHILHYITYLFALQFVQYLNCS